MKEIKSIIELTKYVNNIQKLDDEIDRIIAGYKDYAETITDIAGPVRSIISIFTLAREIKFKKFLKGFATAVNSNTVDERYLSNLERYLSLDRNLGLVAEIIDSSLEAKSSKCSLVLGYFAGDILNSSKELEYKDMVLVNSLRIMLDNDIDYFLNIYEHFKDRAFEEEIRVHDTRQEFEQFPYPIVEMENTIEKLKGVQALGYGVGGLGNVGNAWGAFKFNENSTYLYVVLNKVLKEHVA